jgi:glycosyltransferase involved in cell wall biosynthesis
VGSISRWTWGYLPVNNRFRLGERHFVRCFMPDQARLRAGAAVLKTLGEMPQGSRLLPVRAEGSVRRLQSGPLPYFAAFDTTTFILPPFRGPRSLTSSRTQRAVSPGTAPAYWKLACLVLTFSADLFLERRLLGKPLGGLHGWVAAVEARFTYRQADAILCVSEAARDHLIARWDVEPDKITVMPNGVDTERFRPVPGDPAGLRQRYGFGGDPVVAFVGGFQPWHGLNCLVESFAVLLKQARSPAARRRRAARPEAAAVMKHGLQEKVVITGFVPQDQIPPYLGISTWPSCLTRTCRKRCGSPR